MLSPRELWRYRDLALQIVVRDITLRYRQTALGAAWAILQPVAFMIIFSVFFGRVAGVSSGDVPYALFSLAALVPWAFFSSALLLGSESLVMYKELVSKIYFPRIFMPMGVIGAGFVDLGISTAILLAVVLVYGIVPSAAILFLPFLVVLAAAALLGATALLSAVNVRYRDVRYVVPFAVQMWLFVTPVVYSGRLDQPALADALGDQPDGRRGRRLPLGGARHRQPALGADRNVHAGRGDPAADRPRLLRPGGAQLRRHHLMSDVAIEVHELGKSFRLGISHQGYGTLRDSIVNTVKAVPRKLTGRGA